jgi:hypothetical protein
VPVTGYDLSKIQPNIKRSGATMAMSFTWEFYFDKELMVVSLFVDDNFFVDHTADDYGHIVEEHQKILDRDLTTNQLSVASWDAARNAASSAITHLLRTGRYVEAKQLIGRRDEFRRLSIPWVIRRRPLEWRATERSLDVD